MYTVGAEGCLPTGEHDASCDPAAPPRLKYIAAESPAGFHHPHPIAPIAPLSQNTWIAAMSVIHIGTPDESLFAAYYKNPGDGGDGAGPGEATQGMCKWDDSKRQLVKVGAEWPRNATLSLNGAHAVQRFSPTDAASRPVFVYFVNGFVSSRVSADAASIADYSKFQTLEPPPTTPWHCDTVNYNTFARRCKYSRNLVTQPRPPLQLDLIFRDV